MDDIHHRPSPRLRVALFHPYGSLVDGLTSGGGTYEGSVSIVFERLKARASIEVIHLVPTRKFSRRQVLASHQGSAVVSYRATLLERWLSERPKTWLSRLILRKGWLKTRDSLKRNHIDLAYFSSPSHMAMRLGDVPFIFTMWDTGHRDLPHFPEVANPREWATRENLYIHAIPKALHVIVDSPTTGKKLEQFYGLKANRWTPLGLLPHIPPLADSPPLIQGEYVIYPAARWPHKNHATLYRAIKAVLNARPHLQLVLTGDDAGFGATLRRLSRDLEIDNSIVDLGLVPREQLLALIRDARALVMPSLLGPTNIPPLEALALGTHAIVSDVHYYGTDVDSKISKVSPLDESAWARAILDALDKEDPPQVIFTLDDAIERLVTIFSSFSSERDSHVAES